MKKQTVYRILALGIGLLLSFFILEAGFSFGLRHNLNIKSSYVCSHTVNAQLLVLGPCEPLWMVAPEVLSQATGLSCYNLASSHSDFADNYLHLYLYLKNNKAPADLLLFVTPESFDTNYNTFYSYRFAPFLEDTLVAGVVGECDKSYAGWRSMPFARYAFYSHQVFFPALQGWKHYFTKKEVPYYPDGFEPPAKMIWDNHYENLVKAYPKGYHFGWSPRREKYLERIIDLCEEKKINVILYESPVLKEIADYQFNRPEYLQKIGGIAKRHGISYLRFEGLSWTNTRENFISPMVTTLEGSMLFSDTLGKALQAQLFK